MSVLNSSRRSFLLLALTFFAPLGIAFLLYYGKVWQPAGSTEHGALIHPARPLPAASLPIANGTTGNDFLRGKWSLVYVGDGRCDPRCRTALADMQRARELLGRDISRVAAVFLAIGSIDPELAKHPQLTVASVTANHALLAPFPIFGNVAVANAGRIYVVDPLGNLMMSYAADAPSMGVLDDLKKLLKLSHIG
jgi:cytochrome oxidase Cu insertion factor (SCO1/SenC/PrrC family)